MRKKDLELAYQRSPARASIGFDFAKLSISSGIRALCSGLVVCIQGTLHLDGS
jgi:hypothetical protein